MDKEKKEVKKNTTGKKTTPAKKATGTKKVASSKKTTSTKKSTGTKKAVTRKTPSKSVTVKNKVFDWIKNNSSIVYTIGIIILIFLLIWLIIVESNKKEIIYINKNTNTNIVEVDKDVLKLEDISYYKNKYNNNDIIGLLYVPGTNIREPITQSKDNNYYLKHNLYKKDDIRGTVFLDYRVDFNKSKKTLIYSHNSKTIDVPFRELDGYYNKDFFDSHKYMYVKTDKEISKYEIFSSYVEYGNWDYMDTDIDNGDKWFKHISGLKNKSLYNTDVDINKNDKIMILQTCSELDKYASFDRKYLLVISKKII